MTFNPLPLLQFTNLDVARGELLLCQKVSLTLMAGDICHLAGANGTGKTTLLMQLAGILPMVTNTNVTNVKTKTTITYNSRPLYVSHQTGIHADLTVKQNLLFLLNLYGVYPSASQLSEALKAVGLQGYEAVSCRQLSAGQTRRVNLARLWITDADTNKTLLPKLWLLDEPFTALDVAMVNKLQQQIKNFAKRGGAVLITSHQVEGMDTLANKTLALSNYLVRA